MNLDPGLLALISGVIGLLTLAHFITIVLIRRSENPNSPTLINLKHRVIAWWWMLGVIGISVLFGKNTLFALYALLSFLALREFLTLSATPRADHRTLFWFFFIILPLH